ncbi:hypothetical protein PVAP13_7KG093718, partial [Panicum virgatum]
EASMVASPPTEEAAAASNIQANQLAWQQQLGQPRYFCEGCRRNWTQGGTLRNVPVGGRSRKNKLNRAGGSTSSSSAAPPAAAPSSSSNESKKVMNLTQQLLMLPAATAPMPADFPRVLPAFMSMGGGFEVPSSDYHSLPFPPLSPPLPPHRCLRRCLSPLFDPGTTPSFLESLTEGLLDSGNNGMTAPPSFGTSDQQMVGLLQGVDQTLELPMAAGGGSGLQQWPSLAAQEEQVVGGDGSVDNNCNNNTTNNNGGGASGGSSGIEYYWQGSI